MHVSVRYSEECFPAVAGCFPVVACLFLQRNITVVCSIVLCCSVPNFIVL